MKEKIGLLMSNCIRNGRQVKCIHELGDALPNNATEPTQVTNVCVIVFTEDRLKF